jgi:hypothetical protein
MKAHQEQTLLTYMSATKIKRFITLAAVQDGGRRRNETDGDDDRRRRRQKRGGRGRQERTGIKNIFISSSLLLSENVLLLVHAKTFQPILTFGEEARLSTP